MGNKHFIAMFSLGPYRMIKRLSEQKTADVYEAVDSLNNERVVIKYPKRQCSNTTTEVTLLPKLSHPNIFPLRGVVATRCGPAPVYPCAEGGSLLTAVEQGEMDESTVKEIIYCLLNAVSYLHARHIWHRDIKLENLLILRKVFRPSEIMLADFGLAVKNLNGIANLDWPGSLSYSPPELLLRQPYTEKVDIWAIEIVMFACLTGTFSFDCSSREAVVAIIVSGLPDLLRETSLAALSLEGKEFLRSLLHKDPARRPIADDALAHGWFFDLRNRKEADAEDSVRRVLEESRFYTDRPLAI
jgi:serine/threonine protein kinase